MDALRAHGLAGQGIHQVEIESLECHGRLLHRGDRLRAVVHPAQRLQMRIVEALHTHRQPRDAGLPEGAETVLLESAGIGLQRDLAIRLQHEPGAQVTQQAVDGLGREQAGRADRPWSTRWLLSQRGKRRRKAPDDVCFTQRNAESPPPD